MISTESGETGAVGEIVSDRPIMEAWNLGPEAAKLADAHSRL